MTAKGWHDQIEKKPAELNDAFTLKLGEFLQNWDDLQAMIDATTNAGEKRHRSVALLTARRLISNSDIFSRN